MTALELPSPDRKPLKITDATHLLFDKGIFRFLFPVGVVLILLTIKIPSVPAAKMENESEEISAMDLRQHCSSQCLF